MDVGTCKLISDRTCILAQSRRSACTWLPWTIGTDVTKGILCRQAVRREKWLDRIKECTCAVCLGEAGPGQETDHSGFEAHDA